jgi:Type IX secretion system protein PorV
MKRTLMKLTAGCVAVLSAFGAFAQNNINVVTTAVPFLRISPDARAGGMGDIGVATSPDANSAFWNVGKTAFAEKKGGLAVTYTPWFKDLGLNDVYMATMGGYVKMDENSAISGTLRYFSLGNIQFTDNLGNDLQSFRPREFAIDAGYSRKLTSTLGLGVSLKYIYSNLANGTVNGTSYKAGSAIAGDIGLFHSGASGWNWGVTLNNLGSKIAYTSDATKKDFIPANLGLGATYTKKYDDVNKLTFGLDVHKLLVPTPPAIGDSAGLVEYRSKGVVGSWFSSLGDAPGGFKEEMREFQLSVGAEYTYNDQFSFRAGYFFEDKTKGNRKYFTLGAGVKYNMFGLNFSYLLPSGSGVNRNPLSNTMRFSLVFDFDGGGGAGGN